LQKGAYTFMDYCSGCHSLQYVRYERIAKDLGIKKFPGRPPLQGSILTSLPKGDAQSWFGMVPPDLSLKVKEKGENWIRNYLQGFYIDKSRPFGVNNHIVPDVAMPNVLYPVPAALYEQTLTELIAFMIYAGEPVQQRRYQMGVGVLLFLLLLLGLSYAVKKSYWKNI
jgi:ubiquinol-cytochrome c reductase cytochrome c1 subunit